MNKCTERVYNGLIKENPTFVLMLGMCPTLAVTTSAINGLGMGLSTTVVLVLSNMLISMLRKVIPDSVRMPAFIVVVASFVTIVQFLLEGFVPSPGNNLYPATRSIPCSCIPGCRYEQTEETRSTERQEDCRATGMRHRLCIMRRMRKQSIPDRE